MCEALPGTGARHIACHRATLMSDQPEDVR